MFLCLYVVLSEHSCMTRPYSIVVNFDLRVLWRSCTWCRASLTSTPPGLVGRESPRDTDKGVAQKGAKRESEDEDDDDDDGDDEEEEEGHKGGGKREEGEEEDDAIEDGITLLSGAADSDEERGLDDGEEGSQEEDAMEEDEEAGESLPYRGEQHRV